MSKMNFFNIRKKLLIFKTGFREKLLDDFDDIFVQIIKANTHINNMQLH